MNYARFLNPLSSRRQPSVLRELTKLLANAGPEMVALSGGFPNPETFPFDKVTIEVTDGSKIQIEESGLGPALRQSLQYLPTNGLGDLITRLKDLQRYVHKPPTQTWNNTDLVVTTGSQDGMCKAFEMLLNVGDSVVVEDYVYSGTLAALNPYRPKYISVEADGDGMRPDKLREALTSWKGAMPKFMYINPTGANPTGTILSVERRKEIYSICSEFDLLILEDDPYYYLQFREVRVPSLYSMDTEGRVIRFDSFSKIFSSGLRLGMATGPRPLIERIALHMQVSTMHTSSLSQVILNELLKIWGEEGFLKHTRFIENFYLRRRDALDAAAKKHLTGLCEWNVPAGGMFLWINVLGIGDTWDMIMEKAMKRNIMLVPGKAFSTFPNKPCSYLRASFSVVPEDKMDGAFEKLANLIKEEQESYRK